LITQENLTMLDDLREQAYASYVEEEEAPPIEEIHRPARFLGMTPLQTCVVAVLLLGITCLLSIFGLLVTGKIVPPFLY
jgi:hypothetical protein